MSTPEPRALHLAHFMNARDNVQSGTILWDDLDEAGRESYLNDARLILEGLRIIDAALDAAKPIAEEHGVHHDRSCVCWQRRPDCGCYVWDQDCPHFAPPPIDVEDEAHRRYNGDFVIDEETGEPTSIDDWGYAQCQRDAFIAGAAWAAKRIAPPTDDEREALIDLLRDIDDMWPHTQADKILASDVWRNRRQAPITDAQIEAALEAYGWHSSGIAGMRAALEAARDA